MNEDKKGIIRFFSAFVIYLFFVPVLVVLLTTFLGITLDSNNMTHLLVVDMVHSVIIVTLVVILYRDKIKHSLKLIKEKGAFKFIKAVIIGGVILFGLKLGAAIVEGVLYEIAGISSDSTTVNNQELVTNMINSAPFVMIISTVVLAPIMEELLFRAGVGDVIKNKKVFIAVSGLLFGLLHVTDSVILYAEILLLGVVVSRLLDSGKSNKLALSFAAIALIALIFGGVYFFTYGNLIVKIKSLDIVEVIGSIVYISMGCYLAYLYTKENNIIYTMGIHAFNNLISMLFIL